MLSILVLKLSRLDLNKLKLFSKQNIFFIKKKGDKLYNGLLEIKTEQPIPESKMPSFYKKDNDDFVIIDEIRNDTNSFVGEINPDITGKLTKMRIKIPNSFKTWLLIEEINLA